MSDVIAEINRQARQNKSADLDIVSLHKMLAARLLDSVGNAELTEWEMSFLQGMVDCEHDGVSLKQWSVLGRLTYRVASRERRERRAAR